MRRWALATIAGAICLSLAGCDRFRSDEEEGRPAEARGFPQADRPVAPIESTRYASEEARDRQNEANQIMDRAGIKPGMTVADIGAGEGYYTTRLVARVGARGRVLAEDIMPEVIDALGRRITRENRANISVKLGTPENPKLPARSFDRIFMVHMYHEIEEPYAFLWHLHPALKRDGLLIVVDANRPTSRHGTPPKLLICELASMGFSLIDIQAKPSAGGYVARFRAVGQRPDPENIVPCAIARKA